MLNSFCLNKFCYEFPYNFHELIEFIYITGTHFKQSKTEPAAQFRLPVPNLLAFRTGCQFFSYPSFAKGGAEDPPLLFFYQDGVGIEKKGR
jgi:hypothetical protein